MKFVIVFICSSHIVITVCVPRFVRAAQFVVLCFIPEHCDACFGFRLHAHTTYCSSAPGNHDNVIVQLGMKSMGQLVFACISVDAGVLHRFEKLQQFDMNRLDSTYYLCNQSREITAVVLGGFKKFEYLLALTM